MKLNHVLIPLCLLASCGPTQQKKDVATQNAVDSARGAADRQKSLHDTATEKVQLEKVNDNDAVSIQAVEHNMDSVRAKLFYRVEATNAAREHRLMDSAKVKMKLKDAQKKDAEIRRNDLKSFSHQMNNDSMAKGEKEVLQKMYLLILQKEQENEMEEKRTAK